MLSEKKRVDTDGRWGEGGGKMYSAGNTLAPETLEDRLVFYAMICDKGV